MARILILVAFVALAACGCDSSGGKPTTGRTSAFLRQQGIACTSRAKKVRIRLHNSGAPCVEAAAVIVVLAGGVNGPQRIYSDGRVSWICQNYGSKRLPLETRCHRGARYFTVGGYRRSTRASVPG